MLNMTTDHVDFFHTLLKCSCRGIDLGNHSASDDLLLDQRFHLSNRNAGYEGFRRGRITHDARNIGDIDQLRGLKFRCQCGCCDVGIDV